MSLQFEKIVVSEVQKLMPTLFTELGRALD